MAGNTTKIRLLAVYKMLESGAKLSTNQIISELESHYGIYCNRRTVLDDYKEIDQIMPLKMCRHGKDTYIVKHDVLGECS